MFNDVPLGVRVISDGKSISICGYDTAGTYQTRTLGISGGGGESELHALTLTPILGNSNSYYDNFRSKSSLGYGGLGLATTNNFSSIGVKAVLCIKY